MKSFELFSADYNGFAKIIQKVLSIDAKVNKDEVLKIINEGKDLSIHLTKQTFEYAQKQKQLSNLSNIIALYCLLRIAIGQCEDDLGKDKIEKLIELTNEMDNLEKVLDEANSLEGLLKLLQTLRDKNEDN